MFFLFSPHAFPYDISSYCSGLLLLGLYLLFLVSPVLALIYYIFDFSILKKVAVTAAIILYFIVLLPFLYLLHALIIAYGSLLFLPVLYLMFGPLLLTLMFVGWYAWAMTRKD